MFLYGILGRVGLELNRPLSERLAALREEEGHFYEEPPVKLGFRGGRGTPPRFLVVSVSRAVGSSPLAVSVDPLLTIRPVHVRDSSARGSPLGWKDSAGATAWVR